MSRQSSVLDGPAMGYGPGQQQRRGGVPLSTVILAIVCVILALLLALSIAGRRQSTISTSTSTSASPSPSGTDTPPGGAADAVSTFVAAWSLPVADRDNALASVTVDGVPETVTDASAAKLAKAQPQGSVAYTRVNDRTIRADQALSDGSTLQLQLVFDQAAVYGWLVSSVQFG